MRIQCRRRSIPVRGLRNGLPVALLALACATALTSAARAQSPALAELLSGVVHMKTFINPDGRTTRTLGREREGSAIVIDSNGLILTIGYLMVEAHSAEVMTNDGQDVPANIVGYDHQTGFGLLQAIAPLKVQPLAFGKSAELKERDAVVVVSAPPEVQHSRVLQRPGMTMDKLEAILAKQMPDAEKRRRADFIVDTSRGLEPARAQVRAILAAIATMPKRR